MGRLSFLFRPPVLPLTILSAGGLGWWLGGMTHSDFFVILSGVLATAMLVMLTQSSQDRGYWQAHREIAEIMQQVVHQEGRTEAEMLGDLIRGIAFQTTVAPRARRSSWLWRHRV